MKYDITKPSAPTMPTLGKGTEGVKTPRQKAPKWMFEPLVSILSSLFGEHVSVASFCLTTSIGK